MTNKHVEFRALSQPCCLFLIKTTNMFTSYFGQPLLVRNWWRRQNSNPENPLYSSMYCYHQSSSTIVMRFSKESERIVVVNYSCGWPDEMSLLSTESTTKTTTATTTNNQQTGARNISSKKVTSGIGLKFFEFDQKRLFSARTTRAGLLANCRLVCSQVTSATYATRSRMCSREIDHVSSQYGRDLDSE